MFSQALKWLKAFRGKDEGVTAIEYGLIAGLITVAVVGALASNGEQLTGTFTSIHTALDSDNSYGNGVNGGDNVDPGPTPDPGSLPNSDPNSSTDLSNPTPDPGSGDSSTADNSSG